MLWSGSNSDSVLLGVSGQHEGSRQPGRKRHTMPIKEHPPTGTVLICDFDSDFKLPEMVKTRPVVVISPKITGRPGLCTVVASSTSPPNPKMPFHAEISITPRLPPPWDADTVWVKGDMIYAIAFHRLNLIRRGKDRDGKRTYHFAALSNDQIKLVRTLVLRSIGLSLLTKHL